MRNIILAGIVMVMLLGCTSAPPGGTPPSGTPPSGGSMAGSANYQRCVSQCDDPSNAGSGPYCKDGCRMQEAEDVNDYAWCEQLAQKASRGECYGTVAKAAGDLKICDRLSGEEKNECVAAFGGPSTG